jgi:hypothetical protein
MLSAVVSCGGINDIPIVLPSLTALLINIIKIVVPILLIIYGMLDLGKAVTQGKEEDIKKAQGLMFKRFIAGVMVFLVVSIVQLLVSLVTTTTGDKDNVISCISCFTSGVKETSPGVYQCR